MPSPFPEMDPYLEHPEFFPDLHGSLVAKLRDTLQELLPEPYFAMIGSRIWIEMSQRPIGPDVSILRSRTMPPRSPDNGGVAVAEPRTRPVVIQVPDDEQRETLVEIYTRQGGRRLVTALEVLSLTNKTSGQRGQDLYLQKQRELLATDTNFVEIDLLRGGVHTTAVPRHWILQQVGPFDYHVCVRRFDKPGEFFVYPIRLEGSLPEIAVPLLPADAAVTLDLQAMFDRCYDAGPYRHLPPYTESVLEPPLPPDQAAWAERLLRDKGLLPPV